MTKSKEVSTADAIAKLEAKDGEANNESARTNEILAARGDDLSGDALKGSLDANNPSLSRSAYTSHKSGFNEDLEPKDVELPTKKSGGQTKAVNA